MGPNKEFSVVFTDRAMNSMSPPFVKIMNEITTTLKSVYNAHRAIILPGSGTYGMEAVARQFAADQHVMVLRNGLFSFRWTLIFD